MTSIIRRGFGVGILGVICALLVSCNKGNNTAAPVESGNFVKAFSSAYCEGIADCCKEQGFPSDTAACKTTLEAQIGPQAATRLSSPHYTYDAKAAGVCLAAYKSALEACTDRYYMQDFEADCSKAIVGNVALGGQCGEDSECAPQENSSVECSNGICVVSSDDWYFEDEIHGKLGDPCKGTCHQDADGDSGCSGGGIDSAPSNAVSCWTNDGLVCGDNNTCVAAPTLGQRCEDYCASGAWCQERVCVAQIASGGDCGFNDTACLSTSYCDHETDQCTPKKADGEACDDDEECVGGDCYQDHCRVWTAANPSSCAGIIDD